MTSSVACAEISILSASAFSLAYSRSESSFSKVSALVLLISLEVELLSDSSLIEDTVGSLLVFHRCLLFPYPLYPLLG